MLKLICLAVLCTGTYAIVCLPNACATVDCMMLTEDNCAGKIKQNGGYCGCCDACIIQLAEGDRCMAVFFGYPTNSECADGLYCDGKTGTCKTNMAKRELGPCEQKLAEVNARLSADPNHMLLGLEKPRCDTNGDFEGMQFGGSQAYCVTKNGTMIDNYSVYRWMTGDNMDCQCARDQYDYMQTGMIGKMFHCEANGNYATVGCMGSVCYCQDSKGNAIGDTRVPIGTTDQLNC